MCGSIRNDIGIDEAIALDSFPDMHGNGRREYRPGRDHRMELAVLATRVDATWETAQETRVEQSPGIAPIEPLEIDADQMCNDPAGDHLARQRTGVAPPQRKYPLHAGTRQQAFAIGPDVFEEQVAENNMFNALRLDAEACIHESRFISLIGAGVWKLHAD